MEHYQPAAAAIIERAFNEARALGHGGVGVEHLLLAFAHDADSSEAAALRVMGLYYPQLRDHVATVFGRKAPHELSLPYNTVTRHILEIAVGKGEASREDLFDALLAFNNGILDGLIRGLRASVASTHSKNFSIIDLLKKQEHGDDLTSAVLSAPDFLPFLRNLEEQALQDNLTPLAVLWASDDVSFLLPLPDVLPSLSKSFARYAYFSENDKESPKQWCYFLFSAELTVVISAHQALNMSGSEEYWCVGSVSGSVAGEVFERLKSRIKQSGEDGAARLKEVEAELATMREACGIGTTQALRETVRAAWQIASFPTFYSEDKSPADSNSVLTEDLVKQPLKPLPESPDLNYNRRNRDFNKNRQSLNDQIPFAQGDFTEAANFALLYARVEAATTNLINRKIDQRALLAGLVTEHAGTAGKLLRVSGVTLKALRELDQKDSIKDLKMGNLASVDYDKEARRILAAARKKARTAGETSVQTVHLLWAIANSGPNPGREALGKLVSDMFAFREEIETHLSCFRHEGYSEELKHDAMLFNTLVADEHISLEAGEAELEYELENELEEKLEEKLEEELRVGKAGVMPPHKSRPSTEGEDFDLSKLTIRAVDALNNSLEVHGRLDLPGFSARHLLFGILLDKKSLASHYLKSLGVTLELLVEKISQQEESIKHKALTEGAGIAGLEAAASVKLTADVAEVLNDAYKRATAAGLIKADNDYIFWALTHHAHVADRELFKMIGLDLAYLMLDAQGLCLGNLEKPGRYSPDFATITRAGLHIYAMLCEAAVADAMQKALNATRGLGLKVVEGDMLAYFLLQKLPMLRGGLFSSLVTDDRINQYIYERHGSTIEKSPPVVTFQDAKDGPDMVKFDTAIERAFDRALPLSLSDKRALVGPADVLQGLVIEAEPAFIKMCQALGIEPAVHLPWAKHNHRSDLRRKVEKKSTEKGVATSAGALRDLLAMLKAKPTREVVEVFERTIELARLEQDDGENHLDVSVLLSALAVGSPARRLLVDLSTEIEEGDRQEKYAAFEFVLSQSAHFAQALGETRVGNSHLVLAITEYFLTRHPGRASGIISQLQVLAYLDAATVAGDIDSDNLIELTEAAQSHFNHFEPFAKQIIANAAWMARRSGHVFFGPEHVLQAFFATGHPDYKTFLVMVLGDDRAVPAPHHMQELVERYTGNGLEPVTQPVGMSQQLLRLLSDICQTGLRPQHSQVTALALLKAIVSLQKSLVPVILAELGISPAFVEANLNSANAAKKWSGLFGQKTPSNWTVDEIENSQTADFSLFSAQTMTLMAAAPQYAAAGEAVAPLHILSAIIEHPHFQFLSPHNENRGPRVGTAPQHAADVRDDLVHDLSRSSKEILLKAHAIMQRHAVGKKRQIEPEHILLAICEVGDDDCESYLARLGMEINRAQLLILGYINRKGRQNL